MDNPPKALRASPPWGRRRGPAKPVPRVRWIGHVVPYRRLTCCRPFCSGFSEAAPSGVRRAAAGREGAGRTSYSVPIQTLLFFTALSFLPAGAV